MEVEKTGRVIHPAAVDHWNFFQPAPQSGQHVAAPAVDMQQVGLFVTNDFAQTANELQVHIALGFYAVDFHFRVGYRPGNFSPSRTN